MKGRSLMSLASPLRRSLLVGLLSFALLLLGAAVAQAATFTVNTTADNAPTAGECSGAANDCGLRQAIDKANTTAGDDTVVLPAGHYTLTIAGLNENADLTGDLDVVNNGTLTLTGAGARSTTIDGGGIDRVLQVATGATAIISGVTITGGNVAANNFSSGGGIENGGILQLSSSVVAGNTADYGGGIHNGSSVSTGAILISNSTISGNTASEAYGGGLDFDSGDGLIVNTSIVNNVSKGGSPGTTNGDSGGAMEIDGGLLTFQNDTIAGNRVTNQAGTLSTNPTDAGAVELYGTTGETTPVFENTIIANNLPSDCHVRTQGFLPEAGVNLDGDSTCFNGAADKHANPLLGQLQNNGGPTDTTALLDGSPAINAAANAVCPATDQRGITRPQPAGGICDIGAYEATAPVAVTNAASGTTTSAAVLNGTVNPTNLATTYHFEYGTTTAYGTNTASQSAGSDYATHAELASLTGLAPNTTYHFRIVATNAIGTSVGADQIFTTSANAPLVVTGSASGVGSSAATVHGSVNPNGVATTYHFDYGTSTKYGKSTAPASAGAGKTAVSVAVHLTGLRPGAVYHYRLVAQSPAGVTSGGDRRFSTKALIAVAGVSAGGGCTRASSANVRVRVTSLLRPGVTVTLDGKRIAGANRTSLKLRIALSKLRRGTHHLTVTVKSGAGTTRRTVAFNVCAPRKVTPVFTG
jgi:hypothetical protein